MQRQENLVTVFIKATLGVVVILVVLFAIVIAYLAYVKNQYKSLPDTHDLAKRIGKMGNEYLAKRPRAAFVIGIIQRDRKWLEGFGSVAENKKINPDGQTLFEIGSITKVFTALTAATLVEEGKLKWEDSVQQRLADKVQLRPEYGLIQLGHLATHRSGLPRLPANLDLSPEKMVDPYVNYAARDLYAFLKDHKPQKPAGKSIEYGNLGVGLLGQILAETESKPLGDLISRRVCEPLGLTNTMFEPSEAMKERMVSGHSPQGATVPRWKFDALAGAGALWSCGDDMLHFLEANLAPEKTALAKVLADCQREHAASWTGNVGLGWQRLKTVQGGLELVWHNGGTGGFVSFIGFDPVTKVGVVILSNYGDAMKGDDSVDYMGFELLKLASRISLD